MAETRAPVQVSATEAHDLPPLFEEFSRVTSELMATHAVLRQKVSSLQEELADKNRRLERKKRLEALGRVAAGVAHEFRNPLGGIRLTVDALLECADDDRARRRLRHVRRAVEHLDEIVRELLSFARREALQRSPFTVAEILEHALDMALPQPELRRQVVFEGDPELRIRVDRAAFTQVLVNLLTNARQAMEKADGIHVEWGERDGCVWIEVSDDGPGIPEGEEERIFHPFHSLREGGIGLGLALVHSRVEAHEGEIAVVTQPWGRTRASSGACFRILLPVCRGEE